MANRIQLRRGGAQEWANSNPTLAQGELGIELDTGRFKIGDGVTAWNSLRYERPVESTSNTANTLVQRDADGNFAAGTITSTLIGNASTASRLASTRQFQLADDVSATGVFDGSANLTLNTSLSLISTLPHYDGTATPTGTYTKVTVDAKGRITNASNPTTLSAYGLDGTVEGASAMPYDGDLAAIAALTATGLISRTSASTMVTRTITGTAQRIQIQDGGGISGNPTIDLITTAVTAAAYNTASLTSIAGSQTVNTTAYTVDAYGRLTASVALPIATAVEGTTALAYAAGTTYSRDDKITNSSKLYQAIAGISAGAGAPTHSDTSDAGSWRYLGAVTTQQKGLASFAQEDFDVSAAGHVIISAAGVDNTQLQNNRISFADGNAKEDFTLDQELTATSGYRGFNKLNYIKINDTSGNLLFGANNTGDSSAGEIDVNVRSYFSDPDITLDGAVAQTIDKTGDGNLTIQSTQNSSSARSFTLNVANSGSGSSTLNVTAEDLVDIKATEATNGKVHVEGSRFQADYIGSSGSVLHLDPGDDRAVTGTCRIHGDLQVDGTTTTINSTTMQVDDVILTLGGDTAPSSDDNKDRGVEFRYYDSQARIGFFGYDDSTNDLAGHTGAFTFLYNATNTSEVFSGTDAGVIAGNLKLTTNTNSTSNTTGDLVVAGGAGIGDDVNIGGLLDVDGTFRANSTSRFDDNIVFQGASKTLKLNNGSGTTKTTLHTTTGNAEFGGIVTVTGNTDLNSNLNVASLVYFESTDAPDVALNSGTNLYEIQSSDYGALRCDGGGYFDKAVLFNNDIYLNGNFNQRDSGTESWGLRNWLQVRYKFRVGSSVAYNPTYATHNTSNMRVYGGGGIAQNLHVGATGSGEGLFVGKKNSGDTVKFSVLGASGDTTIVGDLTVNSAVDFDTTLNVDGAATFQDNVTINANNKFFKVQNNSAADKFTVDTDNGNTIIEGTLNTKLAADFDTTLNVDGNATFQSNVNINGDGKMFTIENNAGADKFTVDTDNGNTVIAGTLDVTSNVGIDGDFDIATSKFTVASATGNTVIDGTLDVDGSVGINGVTAIDANFSVRDGSNNYKFKVINTSGNTDIIGTLTVGDATQINDTFGVSGVVTATNNTEQTLTGSYAADGAARFSGGIGLAKNLAVGGGARVYGNTELTGSLDLNSSADISGNLVVSNADEATSLADGSVALQVAGGATIDKNTYIGGNLVVYDAGNTRAAFTVTNATGNGEFHNDLTVGGDLTVNGSTTTVNSTVTTLDDPIITLGGDTAPSSNDAKDRGVEFRYYDGSAKIGFFGFDRSSQQFTFLTSATNTSEVLAGTDGALRIGSLNVTGAGTSVDIDNNLNVDGTATVDGQIISQVSSGPALVIPTTDKINNLNADLLDGMTTATANTASTVVNRDGSGDFAANQITAASAAGSGAGFLGNASTADAWKTARVFTLDGVVSGSVSVDGSAAPTLTTTYVDADITALAAMSGTGYVVRTAANTYAQRTLNVTASSGITLTNADGVSGNTTINVASSASNSANNLVLRDASGNFAAGTITATITGNVTGNLTGNADTATQVKTIQGSGNASYYPTFVNSDNGSATAETVYTDAGITYNPSTNTLSATNIVGTVVGNVTGDLTGNADTATTLETARTIGGVSFNGSANINLPGVNAAGNQDTSGTAAIATTITLADESTDTSCNVLFATAATGNLGAKTGTNLTFNSNTGVLTATGFVGPITGAVTGNASTATTLQNARTIGGVSFDGSANINLPGVNAAGNQDTSGTAAIATTVTVADESSDTSCNVLFTTAATGNLAPKSGTNLTFNSDTGVLTATGFAGPITGEVTGNAATATKLATARNIGGVAFDGSAAINLPGVNAAGNQDTSGNAATATTAAALTTARTIGGTSFDGSANITPATATQAANLANHNTAALAEGTNLYYTEARVQDKLDNAYEQLRAMLNNLATATTLTLNLSGDPTPGSVVTLGSITNNGVGGFSNGTGVATTGGTGSGLTVNTTTSAGVITAIALNAAGSGYLVGDTLTIANAAAGGVKTFNNATLTAGTGYASGTNIAATGGDGSSLTVDITASSGGITGVTVNTAGTGYAAGNTITIANANASGIKTTGNVSAADAARTPGTYTIGASDYSTQNSGSAATFTVVVAVGGGATITVTDDGTGFVANETITIADAQLGGGGAAVLTFDATAIHGNGATIDIATVFVNATFALSDITTMEVGATVTGSTSGTTGVITALGTNAITVDNVDGFFKKGETVGANDVTNLTISSFA